VALGHKEGITCPTNNGFDYYLHPTHDMAFEENGGFKRPRRKFATENFNVPLMRIPDD